MATERDLLTTRIVLRAIFPLMKVVLSDDPKMQKKFEGVTGTIQFVGKYNGEDVGAALVFNNGALEIEQGIRENPEITFKFKTIEKLNAMIAGKPVIPGIKGFKNFSLLMKTFALLMSLKILMPNAKPKDYNKKRLKVKLMIYMLTTALSQYNKGGDPDMRKWTSMQPDRAYQISVDTEEDIASYLRVKAGNSKSGRGFYARKRPFVHLKFADVDKAMAVLLSEVTFVESAAGGYVSLTGPPEYAINLTDFGMRVQAMIT
ncbi:MAG: hypothetical protein GY754_03910 [bacterium]|nr:hypothetical protein [bacterium]